MLRLLASVVRLHIVAIAGLGTLTFGWLFTGRYLWLVAAVSSFDWFLVNLLNRVVDRKEDRANAIAGSDWAWEHRRGVTAAGAGLLLGSLPLVHLLLPTVTPFRLGYHSLGLVYNYRLRPGWRRLKQLYFWKNTASAVGFLLTVFCYPLAAAWTGRLALAPSVTTLTLALAALYFFLFELSYEVIYDLRDAPGDAQARVSTYPVVHGLRAAVWIVDGLIVSSALVLALGYASGAVPWRLFIMVCAPLIQLAYYKRALRRGISSSDCVRLTWIGAGLLLTYHLWVVLRLPGAELP